MGRRLPTPSRRARRWRLGVAAVLCAVSLPVGAQQFVATGRGTLRGLPGVEVVVEPLPPEIVRGALSTKAVGDAVARQLRAAGITVYGSQRDNPSESKPYVYVHLTGVPVDDTRVAVAVQLHLRQTLVSLTTESKVVDAMSWDAHELIVSPAASLDTVVQDEVRALVGTFVEDWRAVH